jgi:hypothetical protein
LKWPARGVAVGALLSKLWIRACFDAAMNISSTLDEVLQLAPQDHDRRDQEGVVSNAKSGAS